LLRCSESIVRLEKRRGHHKNWIMRVKDIDQFVELMLPLGLVEVSRSGVVAISRGPEAM
jgi:hypothetical protein